VAEKRTYTTEQMEAMLAEKYRNDSSEIAFEVRNDAGFSASRAADAIAIGTWPSRGNLIEGFEIKASRADWLRELKEPVKADAFYRYVDHWWIVAPSEVVKDHELPPTWGLMCPHGDGLRVRVAAPRNLLSEPMPRGMLAALMKRMAQRAAVKPQLVKEYERGKVEGIAQQERKQSYELSSLRDRVERVAKFEADMGIQITSFHDTQRLAEAYALVKRGGHADLARNLGYAADHVERVGRELRALVETMRAPEVSSATA
jgi:hypothetical protein